MCYKLSMNKIFKVLAQNTRCRNKVYLISFDGCIEEVVIRVVVATFKYHPRINWLLGDFEIF